MNDIQIRLAKCHISECHTDNYHSSECHSSGECDSAVCYSTECRGTQGTDCTYAFSQISCPDNILVSFKKRL